jgi:hypothetical protein
MAGELLGMDAISADRTTAPPWRWKTAKCAKSVFQPAAMLADMPTLLRHFHRMMSQEITREQSVMLLLGNMQATQRFAAFIVNLASRYEARGYSGSNFQLRMSREEIGNYLGLTIESISRLCRSSRRKAGCASATAKSKCSAREIESHHGRHGIPANNGSSPSACSAMLRCRGQVQMPDSAIRACRFPPAPASGCARASAGPPRNCRPHRAAPAA